MTYFKLENGQFAEHEKGLLVGETWSQGTNEFRAIVFMLNFSTLQYGESIEWLYEVEIKPQGVPDWIKVRKETVSISNSNYLNIVEGGVVTKEDAITIEADGTETLNEGYIRQLDFFIGAIGKGIYPSVSAYELMAKEIRKREGIEMA